jgi:hypothetical protein
MYDNLLITHSAELRGVPSFSSLMLQSPDSAVLALIWGDGISGTCMDDDDGIANCCMPMGDDSRRGLNAAA